MLLTCDRLMEKAHDWVVAKHQAEMNAEAGFFFAVTNQPEAGNAGNWRAICRKS